MSRLPIITCHRQLPTASLASDESDKASPTVDGTIPFATGRTCMAPRPFQESPDTSSVEDRATKSVNQVPYRSAARQESLTQSSGAAVHDGEGPTSPCAGW